MTSIANTITSALPLGADRDYGTYIGDVTAALTEREYQLSDAIVNAVGLHFGVANSEVRSRLEAIGMAVRPAPEPQPVQIYLANEGLGGSTTVMENLEALFADDSAGADLPEKKAKKDKKDKLAKRVKRLEKLAEEHGLLLR